MHETSSKISIMTAKEPVQNHKNPIFLHLNLHDFKKVQCLQKRYHEIGKCPNFHNDCDMIRPLSQISYKNVKCQKANCTHETCGLAKNYLEKMYHPDTYKKKVCLDYFSKGYCKYNEYCGLAHSFLELKIPLLNFFVFDRDFLLFYFKTEFCPFNLFEHDKFLCVYAHNYQDYRRKRSQEFIPKMCEFWNPIQRVEIYELGCPKGFKCDKCHGWKELDYHHTILKKLPCKKGQSCDRKQLCSYYHSEEDHYKDDVDDCFQIYPSNRTGQVQSTSGSIEASLAVKNISIQSLPTTDYKASSERF